VTTLIVLGSFFVSGCLGATSEAALCDGTRNARDAHAKALLEDAGPRSLTTGARLIKLLDTGCGDRA
jgi:hypothetical protein